MNAKKPHPIDIRVGRNMRRRRIQLKFTQAQLSNRLDLTFQQIQKYEKGANRLSASRLFELSEILDVPVQYFFGKQKPSLPVEPDSQFFDLWNAFQQLPANSRKDVTKIVQTIADLF